MDRKAIVSSAIISIILAVLVVLTNLWAINKHNTLNDKLLRLEQEAIELEQSHKATILSLTRRQQDNIRYNYVVPIKRLEDQLREAQSEINKGRFVYYEGWYGSCFRALRTPGRSGLLMSIDRTMAFCNNYTLKAFLFNEDSRDVPGLNENLIRGIVTF